MIIIGNGVVITRDKENPYIEDGGVCILDNRILEVGNLIVLKEKYKNAEFIDAHGGVIMPGLINTHNHIYSAFARGLSIEGNHPSNFLEILEGTWWRIDRKLTLKQTYLSGISTYLDCIKNGVTTIFDHHASYGAIEGSLKELYRASKEVGVRSCMCYEISDRDGKEKMKAAVNENILFNQWIPKTDESMVRAMLGLHASFTLSDETLEYCRKQNTAGMGYHIHLAEGELDALECRSHYNMSIVKRLLKEGILGPNTICAHGIHISETDMEILKENDTMLVHNPESNMGNGVGCANILAMFNHGLIVGLGTDGYTNDMLESLKVANLLLKHHSRNPSVGFIEATEMLFENNIKIGERIFKEPLGMLKKGALGDVIILEYNSLTPMNEENYNSHILFGMNGKNTITTIINGKVLMKDRVMLHVNEEEIMENCREEAVKLWREL